MMTQFESLDLCDRKMFAYQDGGGRHPKNMNDPLDRHDRLKFDIFKMAAAAMLKNRNNVIFTVVRSKLTKFGIMTQFNLSSSDRQKFKILKINCGGGLHFEKSKNRHISPRFEQFRQNSAR